MLIIFCYHSQAHSAKTINKGGKNDSSYRLQERDEKAQESKELKAKIAETRNLTRKLIEFIRENRKEQAKNENQSIIVKIQGQNYEIDLNPLEMQNLTKTKANDEISKILKLTKLDNYLPDSKKNAVNDCIRTFEKYPSFSSTILAILQEKNPQEFTKIQKVLNPNENSQSRSPN